MQCKTHQWISGGSAIFVYTEESKFLVTAEHIVRKINLLKETQDIVVLLGGASTASIDITNWNVLARNDFLDICTIQVPPEFNSDELNKRFFSVTDWPLAQAEIGDMILIMGYPKAYRVGHEQTINARILPVLDDVTDVSLRRFTIADENEEREILINPGELDFPDHLGGMSGAPVFKVSEETEPALSGIFTEGSDGLRGTYLCTHAHFLLPNGQLDLPRIPLR